MFRLCFSGHNRWQLLALLEAGCPDLLLLPMLLHHPLFALLVVRLSAVCSLDRLLSLQHLVPLN